jgi:hypothetical protein
LTFATHHRPPILSIEDLFLAGIGFDVAGAYLAARGLLQSTRQLAISGGTVWALERPRAPYAAEDVIRGRIGLGALGIGFMLQAAGYAGTLAGAAVHHGVWQVVLGLALAVLCALSVLVFEKAVRSPWRDQLLVRVARFDPDANGLRDRPMAHLLAGYGEELGKVRQPGEEDVAYCRRVFGVEAEPRPNAAPAQPNVRGAPQ